MTICNTLITALWLVLVGTWLANARHAKPVSARRPARWREMGLFGAVMVLIGAALLVLHLGGDLRAAQPFIVIRNPVAGVIGAVLCACGVALAMWARARLGRNWGMPMCRVENAELVTTGPYALVRHPIYSGMLLAALGSAIGQSVLWVAALVVVAPYFVYSAVSEEKLMMKRFPRQYPDYARRTKMLVPGLL